MHLDLSADGRSLGGFGSFYECKAVLYRGIKERKIHDLSNSLYCCDGSGRTTL